MATLTTRTMRYLLFICNFVFVLTGISLITIGIITNSVAAEYDPVLEPHYNPSASNLLIFIGIFVFVVAFFGCCGALRENHCMIVTFSVIMTAIFVAELAVGVTTYMLRAETAAGLTEDLTYTMRNYNKSADVTNGWDFMQGELSCCGAKNYTDWLPILQQLPLTCCAPQKGALSCNATSQFLHKTPCIDALGNVLQENAAIIGYTGLTIAIIQLLGVIFSCYLAYTIRNDYESV